MKCLTQSYFQQNLTGPFSIIGKSIRALTPGNAEIACCNIMPNYGHAPHGHYAPVAYAHPAPAPHGHYAPAPAHGHYPYMPVYNPPPTSYGPQPYFSQAAPSFGHAYAPKPAYPYSPKPYYSQAAPSYGHAYPPQHGYHH